MSDELIMQNYEHIRESRRYNLNRGVKKLSLIFIFILSYSLSLIITYDKFLYADKSSFSIIEGIAVDDYGVFGDYVILWPDEINYINWIFNKNYDSFRQTISGERGLSTNMYGYFVSGIYNMTGSNWKGLFIIGAINYLLFYYSCCKLLNILCKDKPRLIAYAMTLIAFSPCVINLSSGFMRDLLVIALVNFSLLSILNRNLLIFILCIILMFFLRNIMIVVLAPIYFHFYFSNHKTILGLNKSIFSLMLSVILGFVIYFILDLMGVVNKNPIEVLLRFLELITGFNLVVLNFQDALVLQGAIFVEILAQIYQLIIVIISYFYFLKRGLKVNSLWIPILGTCLLMSVLYGSFLGFFVTRTKLIILWLLIVFIAVNIHRNSLASQRVHYHRY